MPTPRTIAGQAWMSGTRPYVRRALEQTIVAIEDEAIGPYLEALREADLVLEALLAKNATSNAGLVERAEAARRLAMPLLIRDEAT
jgi:hypothetical protein